MRVLQLGKFYPIHGGVEKVMWNLCLGLNASGVDCDMLCAKLPDVKVTENDASLAGNHLICVPAWLMLASTMISPQMVLWMKRHASEYDIIHVHHPDPMAALALFMSGYKGRVVLHWHSDILTRRHLLALYLPLQSWLIKRADKIVGTTPVYVKDSPYLKQCQEKVTSVPIGIQAVESSREKAAAIRAAYPGKKIILTLGRLVPYKGYSYLIEAASFLPDNYHILIGGKGKLRPELEEHARKLGVDGKVSFLGFVPEEDKSSYYGACDLFVLSSTMKTEAFGIVQIEAMSCGKPVIATSIPGSGVQWVNADGVSGYNVPPQNPVAMAQMILAICETPEVYQRFSACAKMRFDTLFRYEKMIDEIKRLYDEYSEF